MISLHGVIVCSPHLNIVKNKGSLLSQEGRKELFGVWSGKEKLSEAKLMVDSELNHHLVVTVCPCPQQY